MNAPIIDPDVDLTDFPFMPIMIAQLQRSRAWLICKRKPQLAFYMLNLWMAAWHGRPAASIENDDLVLADVAGCDEKTWKRVKDEVLRGWVTCSDGRIYHPVVAERAKEAWARKLARRNQTEGARLAREAKRLAEVERNRLAVDRLSRRPEDPSPDDETSDVTGSVTEPDTENVTASKGERQGEGQGQGQGERKDNKSSLRSDAGGDLPSAVERFFEVYPKDDEFDGVTRELALRLAGGDDLDDIVAGAKRYAAEVAGKTPDMIRSPVKWLRNGCWKTGKTKSEAVTAPLIRVDRDTPAGQAWDAHERSRTGKPVKWILTHGPSGPGSYFPTPWPPTAREDAA